MTCEFNGKEKSRRVPSSKWRYLVKYSILFPFTSTKVQRRSLNLLSVRLCHIQVINYLFWRYKIYQRNFFSHKFFFEIWDHLYWFSLDVISKFGSVYSKDVKYRRPQKIEYDSCFFFLLLCKNMRCGMIAYETVLHQKQSKEQWNFYRSLHGPFINGQKPYI